MSGGEVQEQILLKHVDIFDVRNGTFRDNLDIMIRHNVIRDVGKVGSVGTNSVSHIDCSGKFAIPGLFECHAHLAQLTTMEDETKKAMLRKFVNNGITQVRDVGGPLNILRNMKDSISRGELDGPEIFYAGPMLEKGPLAHAMANKTLPGFTVEINSKEDARNIIKELSDGGASLVKTFNKFDVDVFRFLVTEAKKHKLPVVHDPGKPLFHSIPMDKGIDFGVRCFEHGPAPWDAVLREDIKSERDELLKAKADPERLMAFTEKVFSLGRESISQEKLKNLIDKMIRNSVYFCPTLHAFIYIAGLSPEEILRARELTEDQVARYKKTIEVCGEMGTFFTREMVKRNVKILVGQDGFNPDFTLNEMQLLGAAGLSESEIIKGATIYPAEWLGIAEQIGSISANMMANILILNKNPLENIENLKTAYLVLQNGKVMFRE